MPGLSRYSHKIPRVILTTVMLVPLIVYAAGISDYSKIAGSYTGMVFNGGDLDPVVTTFFLLPNGTLRGNYIAEDEIELIEGTISNAVNIEGQTYSFEWTDKYGEGQAVMEFADDFSSFNGFWTNNTGSDEFQWSGTKDR